ncbi:MAG: hypothetical protein RLZZ621_2697 [Gemmatimonadota bacterium]|jgi:DNA-directed RNA polymerase specialized sigma24 family protein
MTRHRFSIGTIVDRLAGRPARPTPQSVQALAAAGTPATEIARRMGLPVDAVRMLLQLGPAAA